MKAGTVFQSLERVSLHDTVWLRTAMGGWVFERTSDAQLVAEQVLRGRLSLMMITDFTLRDTACCGVQVTVLRGDFVYRAIRSSLARSTASFESSPNGSIKVGCILRARLKVDVGGSVWVRGEQGWVCEASE